MATENLSAQPATSFELPPEAIARTQRSARTNGLEIVGYYHSHPSGSEWPSERDERQAWPDTSYVIVGLGGGEVHSVRSWRLDSDAFVEETVQTTAEAT